VLAVWPRLNSPQPTPRRERNGSVVVDHSVRRRALRNSGRRCALRIGLDLENKEQRVRHEIAKKTVEHTTSQNGGASREILKT